MSRNLAISLSLLALGVGTAPGCAYNATGAAPPRTLIFEFSVDGQSLIQSPNVGYYFVLDLDGDPNTFPLINGPAPQSFNYPDPRSYLPFVRDESQEYFLDRESVAVPPTHWTTFFSLYQDAGQFVMWQGVKEEGGTINDRFRQMQSGREWGIKDGRTVQFTLPFTTIYGPTYNPDAPLPAQFEANLAVARRGQGQFSRDFVIDRWMSNIPNQWFPITTSPINQQLFDTVGTLPFPQNLPEGDPRSANITTVNYRVVSEASQ